MQQKLKVRATGPMLRFDNDARVEVSHTQWAQSKEWRFEVPNNHFWRSLVLDGSLVLVGEMDTRKDTSEPAPAEQPAQRRKRK